MQTESTEAEGSFKGKFWDTLQPGGQWDRKVGTIARCLHGVRREQARAPRSVQWHERDNHAVVENLWKFVTTERSAFLAGLGGREERLSFLFDNSHLDDGGVSRHERKTACKWSFSEI